MNQMKQLRIQHPLPPAIGRHPRVLILGSMPGAASLAAREYYAHPRNLFWDIMGDLVGAGRDLPYPARLQRLTDAGIALWDVMEQCEREGSLDAGIRPGSVIAHPIQLLVANHPGITHIFLNGRAAESCFRRLVLNPHPDTFTKLRLQVLPSTSPAHATLSRDAKMSAWNVVRVALSTRPGSANE